jgi:hypothetical protein
LHSAPRHRIPGPHADARSPTEGGSEHSAPRLLASIARTADRASATTTPFPNRTSTRSSPDPTGVEAPLETLNQAGHCVRTQSGGRTTSECVYNVGDPRSGVCGDLECSSGFLFDCGVKYCDPDLGCQTRWVPYRQGCHGYSSEFTSSIGFCRSGQCYY